jgi:glycogen(starch) synthase
LHIGFVTTESPYGETAGCGIAAYLRAIIPALLDVGHQVSVFAGSKENKQFDAEGGRVAVYHFRLPSMHWYAAKIPGLRGLAPLPLRQLEWSTSFYRRIARIAADKKIDVLESTEAGALFLNRIAPLVIRLHGSEYVFRRHTGATLNLSVRWNDSLEARSSERAVAITTPSQFQANEISKHRGWPANRVHVIPNAISASMLRAALKFSRNGDAEPVVLYTGRLAPVKGIETLLEAARLVHQRQTNVTFVLAGPWQMPHAPETYGLELNRKSVNGVEWVGPQDQNQLIDWYKRAGLFVMPSYYESFGISVVEAMAFGVPVVASDSGALSEIVNNGSGQLVPKGDATALADAIVDRLSPTAKLRNAIRPDLEKFHPDRVADETIRLYESVRSEVPYVSLHSKKSIAQKLESINSK